MSSRVIPVLAAALLWHLFALSTPERPAPPQGVVGRDYASTHYAGRTARAGGNPWDASQLTAAARREGVRARPVHPFLYPPSFLLIAAPASALDLRTGVALWRGLGELCLLGVAGLLVVRARRREVALALVAVVLALSPASASNFHLAQANALAMAVALGGLATRRPAGAVLVGLAGAVKLAPLVLVGVYVAERRGREIAIALGTFALLQLLALPIVGTGPWIHYWSVLTGLTDGSYSGLSIRIGMFANHSPASFVHGLLGEGDTLSGASRVAAGAIALTVVASALIATWRTRDRGLAVATWSLVIPLVPVYTFEHHLLWAWPAILACALSPRPPVRVLAGIATALLCVPLPSLKRLAQYWPQMAPGVAELRHLGLWTLFGLCVYSSGWGEASSSDAPTSSSL